MSSIHITVRLLSGAFPVELDAPFTAGHLREELASGEAEWDLPLFYEGKGVEYLSLFDVEGRCLLDDDGVQDGEEYMLYVHTMPILRFYVEETGQVWEWELELDNTERKPRVQDAYDLFWTKTGEEMFEEDDTLTEFYLKTRGGDMLWAEDELEMGQEILVVWRRRREAWEWE